MKNRTTKSINFTVFTYFSGQCNNVGLIHALVSCKLCPRSCQTKLQSADRFFRGSDTLYIKDPVKLLNEIQEISSGCKHFLFCLLYLF